MGISDKVHAWLWSGNFARRMTDEKTLGLNCKVGSGRFATWRRERQRNRLRNLTGSNGDAFTTYTENGFTVTATTGTWQKAFFFGNPVPDIFGSPGSLSVTITDGGSLFSFSSADLASKGAASPFSFTGKVSGSSIYSVNGTEPNSFANGVIGFSTVLSNNSAAIDTLVITINAANTMSFNIDNIVVSSSVVSSSVPEPGTLGYMLLAGLAGAFAFRKRAYIKL